MYFIELKKKTCLGVLNRGERDKDYATGLKEGGGIEISIYSASIYAMLALFALNTYRATVSCSNLVHSLSCNIAMLR